MRGQLRQEATQPYYAFPVSMVLGVGGGPDKIR
jgi:hypothetical protein